MIYPQEEERIKHILEAYGLKCDRCQGTGKEDVELNVECTPCQGLGYTDDLGRGETSEDIIFLARTLRRVHEDCRALVKDLRTEENLLDEPI